MAGDRPGSLPEIDSLGMWEATLGLPEQIAAAALAAAGVDGLPGAMAVTNVVVVGAGTGAIAGAALAALAAPSMVVPVVVVSSGDLPAFVGPDSLVLAVSWSGDTPETVAATTAAYRSGAGVVAFTGGGRLGQMALDSGSAVLTPPAVPRSRAALGAMVASPLMVLERLGLTEGMSARLTAAAGHLARRRDDLATAAGTGPAGEVARRIGRTVPLVHGSAGPAGVAAHRWKAQVNQNAKSPAAWSQHPELGHDEIAGWGQHGDVTRQVLSVVTLRHGAESADVARRFALTEAALLEVVGDVVTVRAEGSESIACFFELVLFGDLVSLHLAAREGVDPGPAPAIEELGRAVTGADAASGVTGTAGATGR